MSYKLNIIKGHKSEDLRQGTMKVYSKYKSETAANKYGSVSEESLNPKILNAQSFPFIYKYLYIRP
ncbi:hypothetical protein [Pontibacter anaerobius]|uniref:Uncharacterized protein n=1 Tax=Pontibacter anaerobius TaxID=2993940 RepID=A0ABT3RHU8_9BACT|nr:hypothetical protein [Pontibacter anaerobius]MCX2741365.1 hypothetical protein [Pontibacter anaerobius]